MTQKSDVIIREGRGGKGRAREFDGEPDSEMGEPRRAAGSEIPAREKERRRKRRWGIK